MRPSTFVLASLLAGCASQPPGAFTAEWAPTAELASTHGLRSISIGQGPPIVLLHTIRTQADYFYKLAPLLADDHRVIALDLPGHGLSAIEDGPYDEPRFRRAVVDYLVEHDLRDVTLLGESIGGVLALTVAAELPDRVTAVYALNPYDYGEVFGGGVRRSTNGDIVRLFERFRGATSETKSILRAVLSGGVEDPQRLPEPFVDELHRAGRRPGYRRVEYETFAGWHSFVDARERYKDVQAPVTLIYGRHDWSRPAERDADRALIHPQRYAVIDAGHFSALERPEVIAELVE
jgi:pimeloyl-ACP methyl ester carboxylesterase